MWPHVRDFRDFYATTEGRLVRRVLHARLREALADVRGKRILAVGFGTPFLRAFLADAGQVVAVMSGRTGAIVWPRRQPCRVVIADEAELPFPDRSFDRVIVVHSLEWTPNPHAMLRELWRTLADDGRLVVVAPNRRNIWARLDRTPFGHGRPYSRGQLNALLREALFTPLWNGSALIVPPGATRASVTFARLMETLFGRWLAGVAAVTMAIAVKRIYGVTPVGKAAPAVSFAEVVSGSSRSSRAHPRKGALTFRGGRPRPPRAGSPSGCRR
ncbi:class I SAM-dependent methyltransferase [Oleispirillum naphthae]|uniref:class I SAM-dependent methyltransferase n=1 Tax=Oleispirillum naphthae TaxID=2838853 RepID=UPI003082365C